MAKIDAEQFPHDLADIEIAPQMAVCNSLRNKRRQQCSPAGLDLQNLIVDHALHAIVFEQARGDRAAPRANLRVAPNRTNSSRAPAGGSYRAGLEALITMMKPFVSQDAAHGALPTAVCRGCRGGGSWRLLRGRRHRGTERVSDCCTGSEKCTGRNGCEPALDRIRAPDACEVRCALPMCIEKQQHNELFLSSSSPSRSLRTERARGKTWLVTAAT